MVRGAGLKGGASGPLAIVWSRPVSKRSGIWPADAAQVCAATELRGAWERVQGAGCRVQGAPEVRWVVAADCRHSVRLFS